MRFWLCGLIFLLGNGAWAFDVPTGLNESDRREIIRTLGLNAATKMLDNPYPLGGFSGFEVGLSTEFIDIRDIRRLGCAPGSPGCRNTAYSDETEWRFSRITIGKGLYEDVDIFFHFIAPIGGVNVSDYGGAVRWSVFQARFLPINVAVIGHYDQLNYRDSFTNRNLGAEIMVGVNVDNFALYFGGGTIQAAGTFIGKDPATGVCSGNCTVDPNDTTVDPNSHTVTNTVTTTHTVVGLSLHYDD
ncbi:MAG: hypothetical protein ACXVA9_14000, partial [Bdellovibrionales bacterium]